MKNSHSPSIHSIYNNALPFYIDRADLNSVSEDGNVFAESFIQKILTGESILQFDASISTSDIVQHLYFESKNLKKTLGAKTFGLGYPLMIDTFEGELLVAPVFIWQLSIEPAQTKSNAWVVRFDKQNAIEPNYHLIKYLKEKFDIDYEKKYKDSIVKGTLNHTQLTTFLKDLSDRFHLENIKESGQVMDAPGIDEIGEYTEKGAIHWSGVFGVYPPQNKNWVAGKSKPEDVFVDIGNLKDADPFVFPYLSVDPEQITAHELVFQKGVSIVEGVDTFGKTQVLLNILISALIQGKKCLVVSERAASLKRTQDMLAKVGINQLNFLLTDSFNDRDQLLELLKVAAKGIGREFNFDDRDFQYKRNKFIREKQRLEAAYFAVKKPLFGSVNWTETVGLFLSNNRIEGKELLANHLNKNDFVFDEQEYQFLKMGVENCSPLFSKVRTLNHPLCDLNDRVFQQVTIEDGRNYVETQLSMFLKKGRDLHHKYISEIANYRAKLNNHYDVYAQDLGSLYRQINDKVLDYNDQLGKDFLEARPSLFHFPILFSKKRKKVKSAQLDVAKGYRSLKKTFEERPYFEFSFPRAKEGMQIDEVTDSLKTFNNAFSLWKDKLDDLIQEESVRLNSKTAHPSLGVKEEITQLEFSLDVFLEELNESYLYQKLFDNKTLTVMKRQKYLESIIEQMETTQLYLKEFPQFYQWQSEWLQLGSVGQKVIRALVKVKPKNWTAAFESWYFYNLLLEKQVSVLPTDWTEINKYEESLQALRPLILNHINKIWQERQAKDLKNLKKNNKGKYQDIFDKPFLKKNSAEKPLEELLDGSMDTVTDFLPILFVSSHVALNILPNSFQFDLVIYNEANRFSIEPSTDIAALGSQLVIFGSNDSNGNESSLLQYALENGVPSASITNVYEAPVPFLSSVSTSSHAFHFAQACSVESLEGRFHEMDGTNDFEAQHVIRILNHIKQTPQRVFPSVGIVTFTVEQRDLIAGYILKLKQQNVIGSEKLRHLERNGLGVFYVDELFGQQFDILIVSCTYGAINLKGKLTKRMAMLNTQEGISYMHLLINKPLQKLYLLHSFTEAHLDDLRGKQWDQGSWLLSHFIKMADAVEQKNEQVFLEQLVTLGKKEKRQSGNPYFVNEVAEALKAYIDPNRFSLQLPWEDILLPLVVNPIAENAPQIVLHPDGFFADTTYTSGIWEQTHLNKLASNHFIVIPVWSVNWFKDTTQEARKLASQIIKIDCQYAENEANKEKSSEEVNTKKGTE